MAGPYRMGADLRFMKTGAGGSTVLAALSEGVCLAGSKAPPTPGRPRPHRSEQRGRPAGGGCVCGGVPLRVGNALPARGASAFNLPVRFVEAEEDEGRRSPSRPPPPPLHT